MENKFYILVRHNSIVTRFWIRAGSLLEGAGRALEFYCDNTPIQDNSNFIMTINGINVKKLKKSLDFVPTMS